MQRRGGCAGGCLASVFLLFGAAFLVAASIWGLSSARRIQEGVRTEGVVVDLASSTDSDGTTYRPRIRFSAQDGSTYEFESNFGRSNPPSIGDAIGVLYDPANPQDASEDSRLVLWLFPVILGVIGLVIVAVGVGSLVAGRRSVKRARTASELGQATVVVGGSYAPGNQTEPSASQASLPTRGDRFDAEYRDVEPSQPSADGTFRYRVVVRADDGEWFYSRWLDEDPTMDLLTSGVRRLPVVLRDGQYEVDVAGL